MANTTNLDLVKPAGTDKALVSVINANSDKIDAFAGTTNQAFRTVKIDGIQYLRGAFTTSGQVLDRIQAFLSAMDTQNALTFFDVNLTGSGNFHFNGYVYSSKSYGTGIFQVPGGATYLWRRENNSDSVNAVANAESITTIETIDTGITGLSAYKVGRLVIIRVYDFKPSDYSNVGTLPSTLFPNISSSATLTDLNASAPYRIFISTAGKVQVLGTNNNQYLYGEIVYFS